MENNKENSPFTRRQFVKTATAAAFAAPFILKSSLIRREGNFCTK